ncbi:hypothetical protein EB796_008287 [Bugula neritina]|uniref:Uncharacterized protein n=1 Tax=Bugula neritina TaxID=10212 RepID=A0A7J7K5F9_BUGNE|nr:hypothetical protein EB796_008287 [Bugula neritina]
MTNKGEVPTNENLLSREDIIKLKGCVYNSQRFALPPVSTHKLPSWIQTASFLIIEIVPMLELSFLMQVTCGVTTLTTSSMQSAPAGCAGLAP